MRITNNMINDKASMNINGNKIMVDADNNRMTTQKRIDRPSEDPVIAIRSLRLQTSLTKINQYYEKNIPDADSWMDVTETALLNIRDIMTDVRTLCVKGATDTLTEDDRKVIYTQLKKLQEQCFSEGNADYAGRTVFTGFRTDKDLVFMGDDANTTYDIEEPKEAVTMEKSRFYTNEVEIPTNPEDIKKLDLGKDYKIAGEYVWSHLDEYDKVDTYNNVKGNLEDYPWTSAITDATTDAEIETMLTNEGYTSGTADYNAAKSAALYVRDNYTAYQAGITADDQIAYNKVKEYQATYPWTGSITSVMTSDELNELINKQIDADSSESLDMSIEESDYYKLRLSYNLNTGATTTDSVKAFNFYTKNKDDSLTLRNTIDLTLATESKMTGENGDEFKYTRFDLYGANTSPTLTEAKNAATYVRDNYSDYQIYKNTIESGGSLTPAEQAVYDAVKKDLSDYPWTGEIDSTTTDDQITEMLDARSLNTNAAGNDYPEASIETVYQFATEAEWAAWSKSVSVVVYKADGTIDEDATKAKQQAYYDSSGVKFDTDPTSSTYNHPLNKFVPENAVVIIKETGDIVYGQNVATSLMTDKVNLSFDYEKKGFGKGELRPEYYFDSTLIRDADGNLQGKYHEDTTGKYTDNSKTSYDGIVYDRYDKTRDEDGNLVLTKKAMYSLEYTISQNQTLGVNLEAEECFNHDIYQDMSDMIYAVSKSSAAHDKLDKIKDMKREDQYQAEPYASKLDGWLEIVQKEADYYDNNLSKLYSETLGKVDTYLSKINLSITDIGCRTDQLTLTEKRMSDQQETVEELKSNNDNMDLSQIIMDYTSSYTAYQSSLVAAGKLGEQTLLNYI